jgi:hypothetical protein
MDVLRSQGPRIARPAGGPKAARGIQRVVDGDHRTIERDAGEQAAGARVAVDLGLELAVGAGLRAAAHRAGRHRGVGAEGELAVDDVVDAAAVAEHQHHIGRLHAGLEAEAAAAEGDEARVRPGAVAATHGHQALAATATEHEAGLDHIRHHGDRLGLAQQALGDGFLGNGEDLGEDAHGVVRPLDLALLRSGGKGQHQGQQGGQHQAHGALLGMWGGSSVGNRA